MKKKYPLFTYRIVVLWIGIGLLLTLSACANMGRPSGGAKDETPPRYLHSNPALNQTNYKGKRIEIEFDEFIQLNSPSDKVIVSPPQSTQPVIRSSGKKAIVEIKDTLRENTTYTIDFSDAIVDNNERNVLENFSLAFSTGNSIDTLQISGYLVDAENMNPISGGLVGIHSNLSDTAFTSTPFLRITKSDSYGEFTIRNIAPGNYRLYALNEIDRNYIFNNDTEKIAFIDSVFVPTAELVLMPDTLWKDSVTVDTIEMMMRTKFHPEKIMLRSFSQEIPKRYLSKSNREKKEVLSLFFSTPSTELPQITPINFSSEKWNIIEYSKGRDSVYYWINDPNILKMDTIKVELTYLKTDSTNTLKPTTDTLSFNLRAIPNKEKKKEKKESEVPIDTIRYININPSVKGKMNLNSHPEFTFSEPLNSIDASKIHLETKIDTVWKAIPFVFEQDTSYIRRYKIQEKWKEGTEYRIVFDSAAVVSIYNGLNKAETISFVTRESNEYSNLRFFISGIPDGENAIVQLLDKNDAALRQAVVSNKQVVFKFLEPGTYYARIIIDNNKNGVWDSGRYQEKRQPEEVYYYPSEIVLKQNWSIDQSWSINSKERIYQKPSVLIKTKPKTN